MSNRIPATERMARPDRGPPPSRDLRDRASVVSGHGLAHQRPHDPLTYIGPDRQAAGPPTNLPVPMNVFMNMAHVPPRFYNQHQQMLAAAAAKTPAPPPATSAGASRRLGAKGRSRGTGDSQLSQEVSQGYSQGPLTQGGMSQSMSQGLGMSQGDMSQDSVMMQPDIHSQLDHLLSQDSTYQGDRFASQNQFLSQFSQVSI